MQLCGPRRELRAGALIPGRRPLGGSARGFIQGVLDLAAIATMRRAHTGAAPWPGRVSRGHLEGGMLHHGWHAQKAADGDLAERRQLPEDGERRADLPAPRRRRR